MVHKLTRARFVRPLVQVGFVAFIVMLIVGHAQSEANPSPEAFCPFGGIETIYSYVTSGSTIPHSHLSNLVVLVAALVTALVARGAFCGWICPLGALQEWLFSLSTWLTKRVSVLRPAGRALRRMARTPLARRLDGWLSYGRYLVLALVIGGTIATGTMIFRDYDPWSALLEVTKLELGAGAVILAVVLLASLVVERPWCRYACPLGAALGLAGAASPLRVQRTSTACTGCGLCTIRCPMGIDVARAGDVTDPRCITCMRCVEECPRPAALDLGLIIPLRATPVEAPASGD